jgi:signal transduction histidine kinase/CheY-like chemotaxis protein
MEVPAGTVVLTRWRRPSGRTGLIAASVAATIAVLPLSSTVVGDSPSFLPAVLALVVLTAALSSAILLAHFRDTGDRRDLVLSWAYSWSAVMVCGLAVASPGVLGQPRPLGTAASSSPWLWVLWQTGFPALIGLAAAPWPARYRLACTVTARARLGGWTTSAAAGVGLALVLFADLLGHDLPVIVHEQDTHRLTDLWALPMLVVVVGATATAAWRFRDRTGPERWAVLAGIATLGDVVTRVASAHRFSVGWYDGWIVTVVVSVIVCSAMLADINRVKRRADLARAVAESAAAGKATFLSTMSHEIRTPLNAVIGLTGLLADTALDAEQRLFVETMRVSGDALMVVIADILDFSKIESGKLDLEQVPFALRDCVEDALDVVAGAAAVKGLDLAAHLDETCPPTVIGDPGRLRQILVNLLSNALKYPERGVVLVRVGARADPGPQVRLTVEVTDTGIGIPADRLDRLFHSFSQAEASTTRQYGGTGLGLAISRQLAEAMGGELTVRSEVGVGSTFVLSALLRGCAESDDPAVPPAVLQGRSVLIVDANATSRMVLRLQAQSWGMVVSDSASPDEALRWVRAGSRFDVAVLDTKLPGMGAAGLAAALHRYDAVRHIPVVSLARLGDRTAPTIDLLAASLTKPVKAVPLRNALTAALGATVTPPPIAAPAVTTPTDRPLRILLAEDNPINQLVNRLIPTKLGHRVDVVENGQEVLDALRTDSYDVVLMDVQMPEMDGLEATRRIRAECAPSRQPWIIALTASADRADRAACLEAGMDAYLSKPMLAPELLLALDAVPCPEPAGR